MSQLLCDLLTSMLLVRDHKILGILAIEHNLVVICTLWKSFFIITPLKLYFAPGIGVIKLIVAGTFSHTVLCFQCTDKELSGTRLLKVCKVWSRLMKSLCIGFSFLSIWSVQFPGWHLQGPAHLFKCIYVCIYICTHSYMQLELLIDTLRSAKWLEKGQAM